MSEDNLSQLRICVEKTPIISNNSKDLYRIAFLKESIWDINTELTIQFIGDDNKINWTPLETLKDKKDDNGNIIQLDPLEYNVRKLNIKDAFIKTISDRIIPLIGLKIKFVDTNGIIRISFDPNKGSYSLIGKQCLSEPKNSETINFAWADVPTFIHEFMHALGAIHEHQNPSGNDIEWDKSKVYKWAEETQGWNESITNKNIIDKYKKEQLNGSNFDPNSIMLYFYPSTLTINNKGTHQNLRMSLDDMIWLNKMYPGSNIDPHNFYNNIYINKSSSIVKIIIICIIIIILIIIIYFIYKRFSIINKKYV